MKKLLPTGLFIFACLNGLAQAVLETNPTSLKWKQVNSPNFRIIFPEGFETQASRMANTLEFIRKPTSQSLGSLPRRLSVILQNQTSYSNGFVSVVPRRAEFFTMPSQNYNFIGTNDWLDMLAVHEYRHVVQYQHATQGFNRLAYYLFGPLALSGMAHASVPSWFWEGDAVAAETAFTRSGRGRIPNFALILRTNLLEGRTFNYHKQYLGSFKHRIPDHYVLGYHMVTYLRNRTDDPNIWSRITGRAWKLSFVPFTFSNAIKKEVGLSVTKLYREMANDLYQEWSEELKELTFTSYQDITPQRGSAYTDYLYPQPLKDGSVLVMKRGIGDIEQFVVLKDNEEKIFTPGYINNTGMISVNDSTILWNEFGFDPRWPMRTYTLIKAFDMRTRTEKVIGPWKSRYASADLSPAGDKVVTVYNSTEYETRLQILDFNSGAMLQEFPNPQNYFYSMPRWDSEGKRIVVLRTGRNGKTISIFDAATGNETEILPPSDENFGYPVLYGNYLLFNSPVSGIDNIYAIDMATRKRYQVTVSRYGAYNPALSADGKTLYYNEQSRNGLKVVKVAFDPARWKPYDTTRNTPAFYERLVEQEGRPDLLDSIPANDYPVSGYSKLKSIVNPYSWGLTLDNNLAHVTVGIASVDLLSTTSLYGGYRFDLNERTGMWTAGLSYQGLFPIIDITYSTGKRSVNEGSATTYIVQGTDTSRVINDIVFDWTEHNIEAGLRIPLVTTRSKYSSSVTIGNAVGFTHIEDFQNSFSIDGSPSTSRHFPAVIVNGDVRSIYPFLDYKPNGNFLYNRFNLTAYRLLKRSKRDIYSRWGQILYLDHYSTPYGGNLGGGLFSLTGYLYFPGFFKHHSIHGHAAYQHTMISPDINKGINEFLFRNTVPLPRGLSVSRFRHFYTTSVNYSMPLRYPDMALGPFFYLQRMRGTFFWDYAFGDSYLFQDGNQTYASVGGELWFDFNLFRWPPLFSLALRYAHGLTPSTSRIDFVIGTFNF